MLINVGFDISYEVWTRTPMVLMLSMHPSRDGSVRLKETLTVEPSVGLEPFVDGFGNRCTRIVAPPGIIRLVGNAVVENSGEPDLVVPDAVQHPVEELPFDTLQFLLPSRYCEMEKLGDLAWKLFGQTAVGWPRVQAICTWVHGHVTFGYHFARGDKTAVEVYAEREGVCRDFMHLAVTFCRCMNIPARYATGYLGDFGVPVDGAMDFSAWFEVFLGGKWHTFDARHDARRIGRVLMATGRDATDVALTTTFGKHALRNFTVISTEITQAQLAEMK